MDQSTLSSSPRLSLRKPSTEISVCQPTPTPGSDPEWQLLLKEYPQLIRRPVVVTDDGTVTQGFSDNGFKLRFGVRQ